MPWRGQYLCMAKDTQGHMQEEACMHACNALRDENVGAMRARILPIQKTTVLWFRVFSIMPIR